jgi:hypothetical protein
MNRIPTLSGRAKIYFWFIHLVWIFPIKLFLYGFIGSPDYYFRLIENGPGRPFGWLLFLFIISMIGIIIFLIINSIMNIERRPVYKSLLVFIAAILLDALIMPFLILMPLIYMLLSFVFHQ